METPKLMLFLLLFQIMFLGALPRHPKGLELGASLRDRSLAWPCLGLLQPGQSCFCLFCLCFLERENLKKRVPESKTSWRIPRHSGLICFCACADTRHTLTSSTHASLDQNFHPPTPSSRCELLKATFPPLFPIPNLA